MTRSRITAFCCLMFLASATLSCQNGTTADNNGRSTEIKYAEGFEITRHAGYTIADVRNPWDTTRLLHRYVLVDKKADLPANLPAGTVVRTPVDRTIVYSAVHGTMLDELGAAGCIAGVCESEYIANTTLRAALSEQRIIDVGNSFAPDVEKIIALAPEAIFTSPFENCGYGRVEKLNVPLIECADYMENTPLGRAEWIRFIGLFVDREAQADSLFDEIEKAYLNLGQCVTGVQTRPTVVAEKKTGATWFVPGGKSYMARLFADAGADYLWKDDHHAGSLALTFESVFDRAAEADFWLFKYSAPDSMTRQTLASEYAPYTRFKAFTEGHIYGCNLSHNHFFFFFPLHPDLLLRDFILMFHPELLPGETCRYHHRLQP